MNFRQPWIARGCLAALVVAFLVIAFVHLNNLADRNESAAPATAHRKPVILRTPAMIPVAESEMHPLWEDNYTAFPPGPVSPWPHGLSEDQMNLLMYADRIVVGRLNPFAAHESELRFHRQKVYGVVSLEQPDDVRWFVDALAAAAPDTGSWCSEFYAEYGIRVWSGNDVLDFKVEPDCGMDVLTATERRQCQSDQTAFEFLEYMMATIPERPPDEENP